SRNAPPVRLLPAGRTTRPRVAPLLHVGRAADGADGVARALPGEVGGAVDGPATVVRAGRVKGSAAARAQDVDEATARLARAGREVPAAFPGRPLMAVAAERGPGVAIAEHALAPHVANPDRLPRPDGCAAAGAAAAGQVLGGARRGG